MEQFALKTATYLVDQEFERVTAPGPDERIS